MNKSNKHIPNLTLNQSVMVAAFYAMLPGAVYRLQWTRPLQIRVKFPGVSIVKTVCALVKAAIDYDNKTSVKAKRADGRLPATNQGLWNGKGEWFDVNRIIRHKVTGEYYLRFYPGSTDAGTTLVSYYLSLPDGTRRECDATTAKQYAVSDEFRQGERECFCVKLVHLISLARLAPKLGNELTSTTPGFEHSFVSRAARETIAERRHD